MLFRVIGKRIDVQVLKCRTVLLDFFPYIPCQYLDIAIRNIPFFTLGR